MIDTNGTRYHLLLTPEDWGEGSAGWTYDRESHFAGLLPKPFIFPLHPSDRVFSVSSRRGATRDRYGHWYWIGEDGLSIRVHWTARRGSSGEHYWSAADPQPCPVTTAPFQPKTPPAASPTERLAGLAATTGHYLAAGSPDTGSLLVFDLHTGGAQPARVPLPLAAPGVASTPFDLAPLPNGGLLVLDRAHKLVWLLSPAFQPQPLPEGPPGSALLFQPKTGTQRLDPAPAAARPVSLADCTDPVAVEPLPDGSFLVLDRTLPASTVRRYRPGQPGALGAVPLDEQHLSDRPPGEASYRLPPIQAHDLAFVPATGADLGVLFVVNREGNQAFGLSLRLDGGLRLIVEPRFYPLRGYTGKALVAPLTDCPACAGGFGADSAWFDQGEHWLPVAHLPRRRYEPQAVIELPPMDGREPGCVWHRLCLDGCIPPETSVRVLACAADTREDLQQAMPLAQPPLYLRAGGAEIPYHRLLSRKELRQPHTGTWELLFQRVEGRYLQIRLELAGDERTTPSLRALRAHYPRFSYLKHYLPGVYQDDPVSADFLERFLANPEGLLTTLEGLIAQAQAMFDPRTAESEALDWLGSWLGLAFDPAWSDHQRRLLIANAAYFFLRRGTRAGLLQALKLALDPDAGPEIFTDQAGSPRDPVRIVERFWNRHFPPEATGDATHEALPLGADPLQNARQLAHRFVVLAPAGLGESRLALLEQVVRAEKPAHTAFSVRQYWALFRVGEVRLGLDTVLGEGGRFERFRLGETALAEGHLGDRYPYDLTDRTVVRH
jgi:phage tail-like protein